MRKKTSKNSDLLSTVKRTTTPKIYSLLVALVNEEKEEVAEIVLKVDYLLQYASSCIKLKDYKEAKESIKKVEERLSILTKEKVDISHLAYLLEGIKKKCK